MYIYKPVKERYRGKLAYLYVNILDGECFCYIPVEIVDNPRDNISECKILNTDCVAFVKTECIFDKYIDCID